MSELRRLNEEVKRELGFPPSDDASIKALESLIDDLLTELPRGKFHQDCPWGCGLRFGSVAFNVESYPLSRDRKRALFYAFYEGKGIVGRCPGCGREVSFSWRRGISKPLCEKGEIPLPENWSDFAHFSR